MAGLLSRTKKTDGEATMSVAEHYEIVTELNEKITSLETQLTSFKNKENLRAFAVSKAESLCFNGSIDSFVDEAMAESADGSIPDMAESKLTIMENMVVAAKEESAKDQKDIEMTLNNKAGNGGKDTKTNDLSEGETLAGFSPKSFKEACNWVKAEFTLKGQPAVMKTRELFPQFARK